MEEIVRFRQLLANLSIDELSYFNKQCLLLIKEQPMRLAMIIFGYFMYEMTLDYERDNSLRMNQFNKVMLDIIEQRKEKSHNALLTEPHNQVESSSEKENKLEIIDLPQNMIQEIASFLPLESYSMFECCNRNIFVAIRNVSTLYEIECRNDRMNEFGYDRMNKYMNSLTHRQQITFMKRFNRVQKLRVWDLELFNYSKNIKWKKVRYLSLYLYGERPDVLQYDKLLQTPFHSLKHLCLVEAPNMNPFLEKLSDRLESLHLCNLDYYDTNVKYSKLHTLILTHGSPEMMADFIKRNTQQIQFLYITQIKGYTFTNTRGFIDLMQQIYRLSSLKSLVLSCVSALNIDDMTRSLEKYLQEKTDKISGFRCIFKFKVDRDIINIISKFQKLCDLFANWTQNDFELSLGLPREYHREQEDIANFIGERNHHLEDIAIWRAQSPFVIETKYNTIKVMSSNQHNSFTQHWRCCGYIQHHI